MVQTALKGHLMLAGDNFSDRLMSDRGKEYPDKTQQDRYDPSEGRGRYDIAVTYG